ncbi:MAG: hypothetical protein IKN67_01385 [Alphaproteobacteria bacterium]|nr:hypothetical protein [Alphaproteobacteria bacterium]
MKKVIIISMAFFYVFTEASFAAGKMTYTDEASALGSIAGQGLACHAKKYHQYELLARAIVKSKAVSDKAEEDGFYAFNDGKANAFMDILNNNFSECEEINYSFNRQKIFKSVLYSDGKIKMFDGTVITPRQPYNAADLYQKDPEAYLKAEATYKQAIINAEKNAATKEKIPLRDSNYSRFANQFEN